MRNDIIMGSEIVDLLLNEAWDAVVAKVLS